MALGLFNLDEGWGIRGVEHVGYKDYNLDRT